jgi:hypothetical protein
MTLLELRLSQMLLSSLLLSSLLLSSLLLSTLMLVLMVEQGSSEASVQTLWYGLKYASW